ncbi:hypothetical protein DN826_13405 [Stutzerimonas nosocomialis]|uniref:leukotoxin LktA family filamentous adhesin n=1 Tax=Stutzerimonas nosocomialis TaxID=1056496 RepID=UPI001109FCE1|nr:leukotoxin LktA family filamentous adhesin [Stutzerimonas nosocomialis]TLX54517.1 hypothetical protein DN826_13405 [Stutzerimonas nosocomialis]
MAMQRKSSSRHGRQGAAAPYFVPNRITATLLMSIGAFPAWADNTITLHNGSYTNPLAGTSLNNLQTQTTITVTDSVTDITTGSVRGQTGFNSFGRFEVGSGNTVNLHVPGGAQNLVNLVHDAKVVINGTLNGLKDGKIGGNIIFADPHGMVVGAGGVVNVGSLTVTTPSSQGMTDLMLAATGAKVGGAALVSDAATEKLVSGLQNGDFDRSGGGAIEIRGTVNSNASINLFGASALVASGARLEAGTNAAAAVFASTVNTDGIVIGKDVARGDGSIRIVGDDRVEISGELAALMADSSGGSVRIESNKSVTLKGDALIATAGASGSNAGNVEVVAPSIKLEDRARIDTRATGAGRSGDITLAALSDISFDAADAKSLDELTDKLEAQLSDQAKPLLAATLGKAEVVIGADAVLDAGHADRDKAGDVQLTAIGFDKQMSGYADAGASIEVAGTLTGRNVDLHASSTAQVTGSLLGSLISSGALASDIENLKAAGMTDAEAWSKVLGTLGDAANQSVRAAELGTLVAEPNNWSELGALLPYLTAAIANANADVSIADGALITAYQDLSVTAQTQRLVDTGTGSIPGLNGQLPFGIGAAYGRISGQTLVDVASGATLDVGNDLSLQALSDNSLQLTSTATNSRNGNGSQASTAGFAFGMAHSDIETVARVAKGANLAVGRDVSLTALTQQKLVNDVSFKAIGEGAAGGPAIALTLYDSKTRAQFDADLVGARNLGVSAINLVEEQSNSASVQAGKGSTDFLVTQTLNTAKPLTDFLAGKVKTFFGKDPNPAETKPTESQFRLASALAIGLADHSAEAVIGSAGSAPTLSLSGDLAVQALQRQAGLHNVAESTVNANAEKDDGTKVSLSVAAVYSQLDQQTRALIGDGTSITASRIGIGARNEQLLNLNGLDRWASMDQVFDNLKRMLPSLPEVPGMLSTTYANSTGEADKLSMAGSVSVMLNSLDATAWVGDNVRLTATGDAGSWNSTPLAGLEPALGADGQELASSKALRDLSWQWEAPLSVEASNEIQQLGITGNFWWGLFNNNAEDGGAVGAGVNVQITGNQAVAGIGANGSVTAERVQVKAEQDELIIGISPAAGKGASVAGNGAVVVNVVDSSVRASIHNSTAVEAGQVGVEADHRIGLWSAAGALSASENTGVGASVAVNVLHTDVHALVGNNQAWRPKVLGDGLASDTRATWQVDEVLVNAQSSGQAGAFSVAGALARTEEEQQAQDETASKDGGANSGSSKLAESLGDALLQTLTNGITAVEGGLATAKAEATKVKDTIVEVPDKLKGYWDKLAGMLSGSGEGGDQGTGQKLSLAIAGSGSVNVSGQKSRAHLGDIVLDPRDPAKGSKVTVLALNQTHQLSGAGGGALTLAGGQKSEFSSAIAGAVAYNHLYNVTEALLENATLNDNDLLKVEAASGGDQVAMGLGLAVASGGQKNVGVALSGSGAVVDNTTRAAVVDSQVHQRGASSDGIAVTAYDRSRLLIGGGAFAGSTTKGGSAGGSLALGVVTNKLQAEWLGSTATGFGRLDISADSASRVLAGALAGAVATGEESGAGAGSMFVVVLDNEVSARSGASASGDSSLTGGAVNVNARSVAGAQALDGLFDRAAQATLADTGLDLDGATTTAGIDATVETDDDLFAEGEDTGATTSHRLFTGDLAGEAVLGIAGSLAATGGKAGVGGALGVVYTGSRYSASVADTAIDLSGDLNIEARNNTDVLAAAVGAVGGTGSGISGSATVVIARGSVEASLDMTGRTLKADDLRVSAVKRGGAYSLAGNISGSSQNASVGGAVSLSDMQQQASALVRNGHYQLTGDATLTAAQESRVITGALSGAVSGSGVAVGGALTYNRIADTTDALMQNVQMSARNLAIHASQPDLGASIWSVAFNLAAAGGTAGVGAGVAVNLIDAERSAELQGSTVNLSGSATLGSSLDGEIWGLGVDAAGGQTAGVGGSVVVNHIDGSDRVAVSDSTLTSSGAGQALTLDASGGNGLTIASLTGSIKGGGTAAVGGAISVNRIGADRTALIKDSTIGGFSSASLASGVDQAVYSIAVAGGGAGNVAVNGSSTTNILEGEERAAVEGGSLNVGTLNLSAAIGERTVWSLAGAISGAGTVAVGVANANNLIQARRTAEVTGASLTLDGALGIEAGGAAHIRSAAVGGGGAGTAAVGASVAVNLIEGSEQALLKNATVTGARAVTVEVVRGDADIQTLAGNVQGAGTGAGAGAVAVSTVNQRREARIVDSQLNLGAAAARVEAATRATITTLAVSGAGAGTGAVAFSNTSNNIAARTLASVENSGGSAGRLSILASDTSSIYAGAGGVAGAGTAAVGGATAINRVDSEIEARLTGSRAAGWGLTNLLIDADSAATIHSAAVSGGGSGNVAVMGSSATNLIKTQALAHIGGGAQVVAQHNVAVTASNLDIITSLAGALVGSGNASVGASVTVNLIESQTRAYIDGATTDVSALGKDANDTLTVDSGELLGAPSEAHSYWADSGQFNPVPNLAIGTRQITGLAVQASSVQQVGQMAVTASASFVPLYSGAAAGLSNTNVIAGASEAYIDSARINQAAGAGNAQQVRVGASSHSFSAGYLASAAFSLGAVALSGTLDTTTISRRSAAYLHGVTLNSRGETAVEASSSQSASSLIASAGGGIVGAAGSTVLMILDGETEARIGGGSQLDVGSLRAGASAVQRLSPNAGAFAGGAAGVGGSFAMLYNQSQTRAWIGEALGAPLSAANTQVKGGAVSIEAENNTHLLLNVAGVSAGGVAVAGSAAVSVIETVTEAGASQADFGTDAQQVASLSILARDTLRALSNAGSLTAGGVSMGGSANVLVANSATRALFDRSSLRATGAFSLKALREGDIQLNTVTGGAGGTALGGAIGLLLLGSGATSVTTSDASVDAMDELNKGGNGTLSQADRLSSADKVGAIGYQDYVWNEATQRYELVEVSDGSAQAGVNDASRRSLGDRLDGGSLRRHETLARASDSSIVTGGASEVLAQDRLYASNLVGNAVLGYSGAAGAAFALTLSNAQVAAELIGSSLNTASLDLKAQALALKGGAPAVTVDAISGAGGFGVGLGAAVGVALMNNSVGATLGGTLATRGSLNGLASDTQGVQVRSFGAAAGGMVGAGLVLGVAEHNSDVSLEVVDGASLSATDIDLSSLSQGPVTLTARGGAGGILAGVNASVLVAQDRSRAHLKVGSDAALNASDTLSLTAHAAPQVSADSLGISLGGYLSAGATIVDALANAEASLLVGSNARLQARSAMLASQIGRNGNQDTVNVKGLGISGGVGVSANAVVATARNTSRSLLQSDDSSRFVGLGGDWSFVASTDVRQRAQTEGYAAGLLTLGAHVARATADTATRAEIGGLFGGAIGTLAVNASAAVDNEARSTAGQGGLVSGAASVASTRDHSTTLAQLYARGLDGTSAALFNAVALGALHRSHFNAYVDSINASLVGASGAHADNSLQVATTAELRGGSRLESYAYEQVSRTEVDKSGGDHQVRSGSGGVIDAAAAQSISNIAINTRSLIGDGVHLHLIGDFRTPKNLLVQAYNQVYARDLVKLDSGGAIAVALAKSQIDVSQADASVIVGSGADLLSIGDIILSASGKYDVDARANGKTYGLAGAAQGYSLASVDADYQVTINGNATLLGYGDIRLYAGQSASGSSNQATLTARTDLWNNTAFPVRTKPDADAIYRRSASITVAGGAEVNSVGDVYAYADRGYGNLLGKGVAKDLYTEALNAIGLSVEITSGRQVNDAGGVVRVDGALNSGYYNKRQVHISGLEYWVDGQKVSLDQLAGMQLSEDSTVEVRPTVTTSDDNITYRLVEGTYSQYISARVAQLNKQLADYGLSPTERTAMQAELNLLQKSLDALFAEMGGDASEGASLSRDQKIQIFELDPILAKPGNVFVTGDALIGSGRLNAPGDAEISVINDSSAFLRILGLEIPHREGGQLLFNRAALDSAAAIDTANAAAYKNQANFSSIIVSGNSPEPRVTVTNSYNPATGIAGHDGLRAPAPDIYIDGRIFNQRGLVSVTAAYGSVYANADIRGKTLAISAGRDFVLNSEDAFFHVGGDPATNNNGSKLTAPAAGSGVVAGNNVVISAQYLNINGLIQSGVANWNAAIEGSTELTARIDAARVAYQSGKGPAVIQLQTTDARSGRLGYSYDLANETLVLDAVEVAGGYMELTGYIMSTGNGQLSVLDGYSQVSVSNASGYTLGLSGIDLGTGTQGTLRINDVRRDNGGNEYVWSSIYTRGLDSASGQYRVHLQQGLSAEVLNASRTAVGSGRDAVYNPVSGRSYVWLTGQDQTATTVETRYKDSFWGAFNVGDGTLYHSETWSSGERPIDGAEYMGSVGGSQAAGDILRSSETYNTGDDPNVSTENWTTCKVRVLWCQVKRSWMKATTVQGQKVVNRYSVRADNPVNISFIGADSGNIGVTSSSDVVLLGSLFNQNGNTSITSGGRITQASSDLVVQAQDLTLDAHQGIGTANQGLMVQVGRNLAASSDHGDINLQGLNGGLHLTRLEATRGNVSLSAQGNITTGAGTVIKGHAISLVSTHGSIGAAGALVNIDTNADNGWLTTLPATLKASAVDGIFLNEVSGDLLVDQVIAGGDVHLRVADGDLLDANTSLSYDERSLAELQDLWADMGLTGQAARDALEQQKVALEQAGQHSYERYWQLRTDALSGEVTVFDLDQVKLGAGQIAQLKAQNWSDAQIASEQARLDADYLALHERFGGTTYDPSFKYSLGAAELAQLEKTAEWSEDQLQYSVSAALLSRGTDTQVKVEEMNVQGRNITLQANRVGQVLADDVLIDLNVGIGNLSKAQLAALAGAELDDVYFDDPNDQTRMRIVQRDDLNISASGTITVTAQHDVYLGGEHDFNLYDVQGDTVRIKTDGNIESARGSTVVVRGHDVVLESSNGSIGGQGSLHIDVSGDLTARARLLNLSQAGDLSIQRLTGLDSLTLNVGGQLKASGQNGEHLLGGAILVTAGGDMGEAGNRIQLNSQAENLTLDIGGDAWIGGIQDVALQPGNLSFGDVSVGGRLDIADAVSVTQYGDWSLGSLVLELGGNWSMDTGTRLDTLDGLQATVAGNATLGDLSASAAGADVVIAARQLLGNAAGVRWQAADRLQLTTTDGSGGFGDIGRADRQALLDAHTLQVRAAGQLFADLTGNVAAGYLISQGDQTLNTLASLSLDSLRSEAGRVHLQGDGLLGVGTLEADGDIDLSGSGLSLALGTVTSAEGDVRLTIGGDATVDDLRVETGRLAVNAHHLSLGRATVAQDTGMTLGGDLTLGELTGKGLWTLQAANAVIGTARLAGDVTQMVGGTLAMDRLESGGNWSLTGHDARIGDVEATGTADLDLGGDLQLDSLVARDSRFELGSGSAIGALTIDGDLNLKVAGLLDLDSADVTGLVALTHTGAAGTALRYGTLNVGETLTVTGAGDWTGGRAKVDDDVRFDVGSADVEALTSGAGLLSLKASGRFAAGELTSLMQSVNLLAGSAVLGDVAAASELTVLTDGDLSIQTGRSGGDLRLSTVAGSLGTIRFGTLADPDDPGVLVPAHLTSDTNIYVETDGDVFGGNAEARQLVRIVGRNLFFGRAQSLEEDVFLQSTGPMEQGEGNITGLLVDAKRDVGIIANGDLSMPTVKFGGTYSLKAGRDLVVGVGRDLDISGYAEAGRDLLFTIAGKVDLQGVKAGRHVSIESGQSINVQETVTAGGDVVLRAASGDITVGGGIHSTGAAYEGQPLNGNVLVIASGDVTTPVITAASGGIDVQGHSLRVADLSAADDIALLARGLIDVRGTSQSGGSQYWQADESIHFARLLADGQALLDSLLDTRGSLLKADQGARAAAGWRAATASPASIHLDEVEAPTLSLWAGDLIRVGEARLGQSVDLHGRDVALYGRHTGNGQLNLWVTGSGKAFTERLVLDLEAADVLAPQIHAVDSRINVSGDRLDIVDARGVDLMAVTTRQASVMIDNLSPAYRSQADVQLYELDKAFALKQDGLTSTTSAYVVHRRITHQVLVPNFDEKHTPAPGNDVLVQGVSAARYSEQQLSGELTRRRLAPAPTPAVVQWSNGGDWLADWNLQPAAVRLNLDVTAYGGESEVAEWEL